AADNFATYVILQFHEDAHALITGAAYSYRLFVKNVKPNPEVTLPLAAFSSNHGEPEQRYFNLLCIAYGSDDKLFADLVEKGHLPKSRARDCRYEFEVLRYGFRANILPHIDQDLARKMSRTDWLDIFVPRPAR